MEQPNQTEILKDQLLNEYGKNFEDSKNRTITEQIKIVREELYKIYIKGKQAGAKEAHEMRDKFGVEYSKN